MKQASVVVMGEKRTVNEYEVRNVLEAVGKSGMGKNDKNLVRAIVEDWSGRRLNEMPFRPDVMAALKAGGTLTP